MSIAALEVSWPAPPGVRAAFTLRDGGVSAGPFSSLNLGTHVGDEPAAVAENRRRVRRELTLPDEPLWLSQVHGTQVLNADAGAAVLSADGAITRARGRVLSIQVADCLPVLLSSEDGAVVGAAHAGWKRGTWSRTRSSTPCRTPSRPTTTRAPTSWASTTWMRPPSRSAGGCCARRASRVPATSDQIQLVTEWRSTVSTESVLELECKRDPVVSSVPDDNGEEDDSRD